MSTENTKVPLTIIPTIEPAIPRTLSAALVTGP